MLNGNDRINHRPALLLTRPRNIQREERRERERAVLDGTDKVFPFISRESSELDRGTRHTGFRLTAFSTLFYSFIFFLPVKFFSPWYQRDDVFEYSSTIIKREIMNRNYARYATINDSNEINLIQNSFLKPFVLVSV